MTVFFFGGPCGGEFGAEHGSCGFGLLFFSPFRRKDDLSGEKKIHLLLVMYMEVRYLKLQVDVQKHKLLRIGGPNWS